MRVRKKENQESAVDERNKCIVRWSIENEELTDRIKLPKQRTDAEEQQSSKSVQQASIKETQKFCQIVPLPKNIETVITPDVFFARSSDPVPEVKETIKNEFFDKMNTPIALNFDKKRKVTLSSESMKKFELDSKKLNKFIQEKGQRRLSKPEKKLDKCIEAASKMKRVKKDPIGLEYRNLFGSLFSKKRMQRCPNLLKDRLETMIDLRYDFNYENRSYFEERKLKSEQLKSEKLKNENRPPIKLKIPVPQKKSSGELAVPVKKSTKSNPENITPSSSASSSSSSVVLKKRKSTTPPDFENVPYRNCLAALPKIPLKPRTEDPLKKSDQGNVQTGKSAIQVEVSEEERLRILKDKEKEKKEKEKKEAEEKRRRKEEKERKEEQKREQERIRIRNQEESKRIENEKRKEKEEIERVLKEQEAEERRRLHNEELEKARKSLLHSMNQSDKFKELREKNVAKVKEKVGMENTSRNIEAEPPAKQMKLDRHSRAESAPRDEFYVEDERTIAISSVTDNSVFPTAIATVPADSLETGSIALNFPIVAPAVLTPKYLEGEKTRLFQQHYRFPNYSSARFDIQKKIKDFRESQVTLVCDEDGPLKDVQLDRLQRDLIKNLESLRGLDDIELDDLECVDEWSEGEQRKSESFKEEKVWDYSKVSVFTLLKKYEWPFERSIGIVWPIVLPTSRSDIEYVRRLLAYRSCSGKRLSDMLCINEPTEESEGEKFLNAYKIAGEDEDCIDEQNQYFMSPTGRFANRTNYVRVATDQTREDGSKKHMERYQKECEMEDRYMETANGKNDGTSTSCTRKKLINTYVKASRIDVYSVRDKSYSKRYVGTRDKTTYPEWTESGFRGFSVQVRDETFAFALDEMTKHYDSRLCSPMTADEFDLWCTSPLLASIHLASGSSLIESFLPPNESALIKATQQRFRRMCLSNDVNQTKLSSIEHICKLTQTEKSLWNIILNNLLTNFKDLPSLPQLLDRPIYSRTLNSAYEEVLRNSNY